MQALTIDMTPEEIGERDAGCSAARLAEIVRYAEMRAFHRGRRSLESAVAHFETAYRTAVEAKDHAAAKTIARIAYSEWLGQGEPNNKEAT